MKHPPSIMEEEEAVVTSQDGREHVLYLAKSSSRTAGQNDELLELTRGFERALTMDTEAESSIVSVATASVNVENDTAAPESEAVTEENMDLFDFDEIQWGARLGKGAFAVVSEIRSFDLKNDRKFSEADEKRRRHMRDHPSRYALKYLLPQKDKKMQKQAVADLQTESSILSKVDHPNIIKLHAYRMTDNHHFLVMDRLTGTLEERIPQWIAASRRIRTEKLWSIWDTQNHQYNKAKRALFIERLQVAHKLALSLAYLHEHRIVYRDLKPGNIGFDMDRYVKLFDFGLARTLPDEPIEGSSGMMDDVYKMSGRVGTLLYMAPELWRMEPYNTKVDTYAFAHILWEILSLEKPYASYLGSDFKQEVLVKAIIDKQERPPIDKKWPTIIQDLLPKAWAANAKDRPSMAQVCAALKNCIPGLQDAAERLSSPSSSGSSTSPTKKAAAATKRNPRRTMRRSSFM